MERLGAPQVESGRGLVYIRLGQGEVRCASGRDRERLGDPQVEAGCTSGMTLNLTFKRNLF